MSDSIHNQLLTLFETELHVHVASSNTDLIDEGLLDSLVFVDLIMKLETTFGIEIPVADLDFDQFRSVERIAVFLKTLQAGCIAQESAA